ncbi:MAG: hypothetical protein QM750_19890 [Rubrivivax sp.]
MQTNRSSHLRLVVNRTALPASTQPRSSRCQFWFIFLRWLSHATDEDGERLERVLAPNAHHVRPLVEAMSDAMLDERQRDRLPISLVDALCQGNWAPERPDVTDVA